MKKTVEPGLTSKDSFKPKDSSIYFWEETARVLFLSADLVCFYRSLAFLHMATAPRLD